MKSKSGSLTCLSKYSFTDVMQLLTPFKQYCFPCNSLQSDCTPLRLQSITSGALPGIHKRTSENLSKPGPPPNCLGLGLRVAYNLYSSFLTYSLPAKINSCINDRISSTLHGLRFSYLSII